LAPVLIAAGVLAALALAAFAQRRVRLAALAAILAALLVAPATWAVDTLGHATSGTFPAGGPTSASAGGFGGFGGGLGGRGGGLGGRGGLPGGGLPGGGPGRAGFGGGGAARPSGTASAGGVQLFGPGGGGVGGGGAIGAPLGNSNTIAQAIAYAKSHGGGTVAVASQSSAATAIIDDGADVAGIGGFSGRESDVSIAWLASEVRLGKIRWVLDEGSASGAGGGAGAGRLPGDTRKGSSVAIAAAAKVCRKVTLSTSTLYDCQGRASQLLGTQQSTS
jgi:hypothetical protein